MTELIGRSSNKGMNPVTSCTYHFSRNDGPSMFCKVRIHRNALFYMIGWGFRVLGPKSALPQARTIRSTRLIGLSIDYHPSLGRTVHYIVVKNRKRHLSKIMIKLLFPPAEIRQEGPDRNFLAKERIKHCGAKCICNSPQVNA